MNEFFFRSQGLPKLFIYLSSRIFPEKKSVPTSNTRLEIYSTTTEAYFNINDRVVYNIGHSFELFKNRDILLGKALTLRQKLGLEMLQLYWFHRTLPRAKC